MTGVIPMRVGALIPIRLASERLPGKAIRSLAGRPVVHHLLERVRATPGVDPTLIVVCTTTEASDDPLGPVVERAGGRVFRGDRDDLIARLANAREAFDLDIALQVDGDDPLVDVGYMGRILQVLQQDPSIDVAYVEGLPVGLAAKAIRARAFDAVRAAYRTRENDTGFGYYFTRSGLCTVRKLIADREDQGPELRVTLDYEEDLMVMEALSRALGGTDPLFGASAIVRLSRADPVLFKPNAGRAEEYWKRTVAKVNLEFARPDGQVGRITA